MAWVLGGVKLRSSCLEDEHLIEFSLQPLLHYFFFFIVCPTGNPQARSAYVYLRLYFSQGTPKQGIYRLERDSLCGIQRVVHIKTGPLVEFHE